MQVQKSRNQSTRRLASKRSSVSTNGTKDSRRRSLVADHVGLVHHVARQLASRLSTEAELDELVSAGSVGLMQAAEAFEPARGLSFSTFAVPRIRGAMLDELRRIDPMPRNVRRRTRDVVRARETLAASLHRPATASEIARQLAVPSEQLHRWEFDAHSTNVVSFHQPARVEADTTLGDLLPDDRAARSRRSSARSCRSRSRSAPSWR
jgi:RNA polymerase sigma factor for flagellar operon FliA